MSSRVRISIWSATPNALLHGALDVLILETLVRGHQDVLDNVALNGTGSSWVSAIKTRSAPQIETRMMVDFSRYFGLFL